MEPDAERLARMVKRQSASAQFVVVSLRRPMIENADHAIGVSLRRRWLLACGRHQRNSNAGRRSAGACRSRRLAVEGSCLMVDQLADNAPDPQDTQDDIHLGALPASAHDPDADTAQQQDIPELSALAADLHHHLEEAEKKAARAHHIVDAADEPLPEVEPDTAPVAAEELQKLVDSAQLDVDSLSVRAPRNLGEPASETQDIEPKERVGGIEILVQMAAKGEIDPKNIDIIDVCDRFLQAIASVPKENLRQSGKILFHVLALCLKAESLLVDNVQDLDGGDDFLEFIC